MLGRGSNIGSYPNASKIEQQTFGEDGYKEMLKRVAAVEAEFGIAVLKAFTAPMPPKRS
jgi:hypothetical protein